MRPSGPETDARQVFHRLAGTWTYWGYKYGYFDNESEARAYYDEMCAMLARQIGAPNSPQWFNTGLHWAYGISGPAQGHHFVDPKTGELTVATSAYEHPAPHACLPWGRDGIDARMVRSRSGKSSTASLIGLEVYDAIGITKIVAAKRTRVSATSFVSRSTTRNFIEATDDHLVFAAYEDGEAEMGSCRCACVTGCRLFRARWASAAGNRHDQSVVYANALGVRR